MSICSESHMPTDEHDVVGVQPLGIAIAGLRPAPRYHTTRQGQAGQTGLEEREAKGARNRHFKYPPSTYLVGLLVAALCSVL